MKRHKLLRTHRQSNYDYSTPAVHHLLFETMNKAEILARESDGYLILSEAGCSFLDILAQSMHNFPCLRIHAMAIHPSAVELLLEITERRNRQEEPKPGTPEWTHWRRTMTLPVFVGYLKSNSGIQINEQRKSSGAVWTRRYRERVVADAEEAAALQSELLEEWNRVVVPVLQQKGEAELESIAAVSDAEFGIAAKARSECILSRIPDDRVSGMMIIGRVQLLTGVRWSDAGQFTAVDSMSLGQVRGGVNLEQAALIRSLGPGRIFLSG